ncbi:MAG: carotenoid biosynthesis protein [Acidobacteria bacterium]|nr:carotenoid biosynthesis protein [Acidobacteriota bacterium]
MTFFSLLIGTFTLRPYVFVFLLAFWFCAQRLLGWRRTGLFFLVTWLTAFLCEFSSVRTGIPFGWYFYTEATAGQELFIAGVPFFDSLSFTFLLYASYCLALLYLLPARASGDPAPVNLFQRSTWPALMFHAEVRTSWPVLKLTVLFFTFIDIIIDPVALRGERWFLGKIYYYPDPGVYYGVPVANFLGWAVVGLIALSGYFLLDRRLSPPSGHVHGADQVMTGNVLLGCGLYYGVLAFNLAVTFWIGEPQLGMTGLLIFVPLTALFLLRLLGRLPVPLPQPLRQNSKGPSPPLR